MIISVYTTPAINPPMKKFLPGIALLLTVSVLLGQLCAAGVFASTESSEEIRCHAMDHHEHAPLKDTAEKKCEQDIPTILSPDTNLTGIKGVASAFSAIVVASLNIGATDIGIVSYGSGDPFWKYPEKIPRQAAYLAMRRRE